MLTSASEIEIPAPWGHISAKVWGDEKNEAVIVTHGFLNNAGSFDTLIPFLPSHYYYICVDLPGHGLSSHFHKSLPLHYVNYLIPYKIVAEFFKRNQYIFLGHSFGGQLSMKFAQLYPNYVSKLILLDGLYAMPFTPHVFMTVIEKSHDNLFKTLAQTKADLPVYTYEEIIKKIEDSRGNGEMTRECAENLARRMIEKIGEDRYVLTYDQRLRALLLPSSSFDYIKKLFDARPVNCPVLILLVADTNYLEMMEPVRRHFESLKFNIHMFEGHHLIHATNPEIVAPLISNFMTNNVNKL